MILRRNVSGKLNTRLEKLGHASLYERVGSFDDTGGAESVRRNASHEPTDRQGCVVDDFH
jgi:hypothetical protein